MDSLESFGSGAVCDTVEVLQRGLTLQAPCCERVARRTPLESRTLDQERQGYQSQLEAMLLLISGLLEQANASAAGKWSSIHVMLMDPHTMIICRMSFGQNRITHMLTLKAPSRATKDAVCGSSEGLPDSGHMIWTPTRSTWQTVNCSVMSRVIDQRESIDLRYWESARGDPPGWKST